MKKNNQSGIGHIEALVIVAVIASIGFGVWRVADSNTNETTQASLNSENATAEVSELLTDLSEIKPLEEIQQLATNAAAEGAQIVGIELEVEEGKTLYVVHLSDGSILAYDALTGESVAVTDDADDEIDEEDILPADFSPQISLQQAIAIAQAERPDSRVEKVELEVEEGIVVYSVRFTDDSRVDVNATTGSIQRLRNEKGEDEIDVDDDFDDDGVDNPDDDDDDNDGITDDEDSDDDNDGIEDDEDDDDDNDGQDDDEDDDDDESDDEDDDDDDDKTD